MRIEFLKKMIKYYHDQKVFIKYNRKFCIFKEKLTKRFETNRINM